MPTEPSRLYLDEAAWRQACEGRSLGETGEARDRLPDFTGSGDAEEAFLAFVEERLESGRVALAGPPRSTGPWRGWRGADSVSRRKR